MDAGRRAIEHPMVIDLSMFVMPPLKFFIQSEHSPGAISETLANGAVATYTPWYNELAFRLDGVEGWAILYVIPADDDTSLLLSVLDEVPEPFLRLFTGRDYGAAMTALVADQWPDLHRMLAESSAGWASNRVLCGVRSPTRQQWAVAEPMRGPDPTMLDSDQAWDVTVAAMQTLRRFADFPTSLTGSLQVLGGPDLTSRRLTALSAGFGLAGDLGGLLDGSVQWHELAAIATGALGLVQGVRGLKG